ncbi:MAG: ribosome biogenesis GTPase Der [Phycisphaerae bacterium]|nr:ribosome biogenesis GTPase Der [Phycisphaerae bacterium]
MALPIVAIVGRPNVGKSSLLNCLAKQRISIVEPTAGVTRDRVSVILDVNDVYFELVDTGGYGIEDRDGLTAHVEAQIQFAVSAAVLVLFVVDAREGATPLDRKVAELLRQANRDAILVANKVDEVRTGTDLGDLNRLGFGEPVSVSALHGRGRSDMLERIAELLRPLASERPADPVLKLAIVGRRNAGKSTFINALAGEERVIVSEVPGTTRDSVDVRFEHDGQTYVAIDTAGVRKKRKLADDIEYYGFTRAERSIRRADVVLFFIDSTVPIGEVDKRLGGYIAEQHKPCVFVVNKWDLAKDQAVTDQYGEYLTKVMPNLDFVPIAFVTATQSRNIQSTLNLAKSLYKQATVRVSTAALNEAMAEILAMRGPSPKRGAKRPKILYGTQIGVAPPTLVFFVNSPSLIRPDYQRFLLKRLRERLPFDEVPIRLLFRSRHSTGRAARTAARPRRAEASAGKRPRRKGARSKP